MADYATASGSYWQSGWRGVLPLPPGQKFPPPDGFTGYDGKWPEWETLVGWNTTHASSNIGLRLPNTVVGIDVDAYGDKKGKACLEEAESKWGPLPETVRSTSRLDGVSGIRLFRVPAGTELNTVITFPDKNLGNIEVCQYFHRYVVVWPSRHPVTERVYRWIDHTGNILVDIPHVGSLPELPQAWIDSLKRPPAQKITSKADIDTVFESLPPGPMSMAVSNRLAGAVLKVENAGGGRHDTALTEALALFRLAERGEAGVAEALQALGDTFISAVISDGSRSRAEAESEWDRIVRGQRGHDLIASTPTLASLADLLGNKPVQKPLPVHEWGLEQLDDVLDEHTQLSQELDMGPADNLLFSPAREYEEEGVTESLTSWSAVDLGAILDGDLSPEEPTVLARDDGKCLFYAGRVNALIGESESGKSWMALVTCVEEINKGNNVVFLDFEDIPQSVVSRLLAMGLTQAQLRQHFSYVGPDTPLGAVEKDELFSLLDKTRASLIVLDGVNAAMTLIGLDLEKNKEATQFHQWVLKPLADTGATLVMIDHVTKDAATRGPYAIGAQSKRGMADGCMIGVEATERFGRGRVGTLRLTVLKDKAGGVRAVSEKQNGKDYVATVTVDAREENTVKMSIFFEGHQEINLDSDQDALLTLKMVAMSKHLEGNDRNYMFRSYIEKTLKDHGDALDALVRQGFVTETIKTRDDSSVSRKYTLVKPYFGPGSKR